MLEGFQRVFLGKDRWYAIRIAESKLDKIKYIAAYQSQPISAITHFALVKQIRAYGDNGKFELIFAEAAKLLPKRIPLGDAGPGAMQGPRYTSLAKLKKAKSVKDLAKNAQ
jgi:hypothetical protein